MRFQATQNQDYLDESIATYRSAAGCGYGAPRVRLLAARKVALSLSAYRPESPDVLPAFDAALRLVALVAGLEKTVQSRYAGLRDSSDLAREAAAFACLRGCPEKAIEWLEQGRCLVWGQLHKLRTPLDELSIQDSQLACRIADVSKRLQEAGSSRSLSHPGMGISEKIIVEDEGRAHLKLAREWDDLLTTARAISGFEAFLQPAPCSTLLQNLPEPGPIVVINIDDLQCDAIAVLAGLDQPFHIPLPDFSLDKAYEYRNDLDSQLRLRGLRMREEENADEGSALRPGGLYRRKRAGDGDGDRVVRDTLQGLWKDVVKPILDMLGFSVSTFIDSPFPF